MENANYKIYKTMVNGQPFFNILPGTNTPYGYTEADLNEARAWYNQHPDVYASESLYNTPLEQVLSGQIVNSGISKNTQGNWGNWDSIAEEQKKNDAAVAAGTMKKVAVGNGFGYIPVGSAGDVNLVNIGTNNTSNNGANTGSSSTGGYMPPQTGGQNTTTGGQSFLGANLGPGSSGAQVQALQQWLVSQGYMTAQQMSTGPGTYGPQTTAAVAAWQRANGIDTKGNPGYFGPISQDFVKNGGGNQIKGDTQTAPPVNGVPPTTDGGSNSGGIMIDGQNYSTGNPTTDKALQAMLDHIKEQQAKGNVINPDLQITPDVLQQFTDYVTDKVHPQYAEAMNNVKEDLTRNFDSLKAKYDYEQANQEGQFKSQLGNARENYAGSGLAFSGQRGQGETNMVNNENRTLDYNALQYGNQVGEYARNAEKQLGSANMTGYQLPQFARNTASLTGNGGYSSNGMYNSTYTPGSYKLGSIPGQEASTIEAGKQSLINQSLAGAQYGLSYKDLIKKPATTTTQTEPPTGLNITRTAY